LDPHLQAAAEAATGFMPLAEGLALHDAVAALEVAGPVLEVGTYQGRSTLFLAAGAQASGRVVVTVDHHRGSEEHQPGWEYHDPAMVDPGTGRVDTLPGLRRTLARAGVEDGVVVVVARAERLAATWSTQLALLFLDGSHTEESARRDEAAWVRHLAVGGVLAIHDVFTDPAAGGQAPHGVYRRTLAGGQFVELPGQGSLRLLRRVRTATAPVLVPLTGDLVTARLAGDDFTLPVPLPAGPGPVHFGPDWPGDVLPMFSRWSGSDVVRRNFGVVDPFAAQALGAIGVKGEPDAEGSVEIGCGLAPAARGRGVATAAVGLLLDELRADPAVRRVTAQTVLANAASRRVLEKNGFALVGLSHDDEDGDLLVGARDL
jgi:predicted O-methyltransferase YrrM/GNAT superfamily N-acetyltransferase